MDRLTKIKVGNNNEYIPGDCNVCHQKNVKVKPLYCKNHYFCRMCVEFVPRLQKGDFSCKTCSERSRKLDEENKQRVDTFLKKQTGMKQDFKQGAVGLRGAQVVTFAEDEESKDLGGNNEEWDHLLQSMSQNEHTMNTKVIQPEVEIKQDRRRLLQRRREARNGPVPTENDMKRIPRKSSFVRLVLPTVGWSYGCQDFFSQKQPFSRSGTELVLERNNGQRQKQNGSQKYEKLHTDDRQLFQRRSRHKLTSSDASSSSGSNGDFANGLPKRSTDFRNYQDKECEDALEIERGTSPCKASRKTRVRRIHVSSTEDSSSTSSMGDSETEGLKREIGKIESTPLFRRCSPPFEDLCPVEEKDDFWDS